VKAIAPRSALVLTVLLSARCQPSQGDGRAIWPDGSPAGADGGTPSTEIACPLHTTVEEVEARIIVPMCGRPGDFGCHASGISPRLMAPGTIAMNVLDQTPAHQCKADRLVDSRDPERSVLLIKVNSAGPLARCPDGSSGGPRMPPMDAPPLTAQQKGCLRWWVHQVAR
jgi:hypothetical protein